MPEYYVVYSFRTKEGAGLGRTTASTTYLLDNMSRINDVEKSILEDLRRTVPSADNVFLTYWAPLIPQDS